MSRKAKMILIGVVSVIVVAFVAQAIETLMTQNAVDGRTTNPTQNQQPMESPSPEEVNPWAPSSAPPMGPDDIPSEPVNTEDKFGM